MLMFNSQALITNVSSKHLKINRLLPGALCLFITHSSYLNAQLSGCQLTAWGHLEEVSTHGYTYRVVWQIPSDTSREECKRSYKKKQLWFLNLVCVRMKGVIWMKTRVCRGSVAVLQSALLPHSKKDLGLNPPVGLNPPGAFLWEMCMFSPCLRGFSLGILAAC